LLQVHTVLQEQVPTLLHVQVRLPLEPESESEPESSDFGVDSGSSMQQDSSSVNAVAAVMPAPKNPRRFIWASSMACDSGAISGASCDPSLYTRVSMNLGFKSFIVSLFLFVRFSVFSFPARRRLLPSSD
jgi:hypothetical protein